MFTRVTTDAAGAIRRGEALAGPEKVAANGWRVWVEHAVTGERIFESDVEKTYKLTTSTSYPGPDNMMSLLLYKTVKGSAKSAHQQVESNDRVIGEVWREQSRVIVSKLSQPLRQEMKWRWFARVNGDAKILGREGRDLVGPGFASKVKAVDAMAAAITSAANCTGKRA